MAVKRRKRSVLLSKKVKKANLKRVRPKQSKLLKKPSKSNKSRRLTKISPKKIEPNFRSRKPEAITAQPPSINSFSKVQPISAHSESHSPNYELPAAYYENRAVLMVRDPWWLFAYWEVTNERDRKVRDGIARNSDEVERAVIRVYELSAGEGHFFDIELHFYANNWYIDVGKPDCEWVVEIGLRTRSGRFYTLVRSNAVKTPRYGISNIIDEEWMIPDEVYWKIIGLTGSDGQKSSMDVQEYFRRYLRNLVSSHDQSAQLTRKAESLTS